MKFANLVGWSSTLCLCAAIAGAEEPSETEKLKQQLKQVQEKFDKQQQEMRENFERMMREQQAQIDALKKQIEKAEIASIASTNVSSSLTNATVKPAEPAGIPAVAASSTNAPSASTNSPAAPESADTAGALEELNQKVDALTTATKRTPINQFNPGIGFAVDSIFSYTSKGMDAAGLDRPGGFDAFLRTAELNLEASVDPFARAYGVLAASADAQTGEALIDVEEAVIVTTSLPWNLTLQGGRFFADFGRLSYVHDHDLPFVNRPLVLNRYIGGESLTDGLQLNYLFPTTRYLSLTVGVGDRFGGDFIPGGVNGYRSIGKLNTWERLSTYFDLTPNLNLETGISGLADPRADGVNGNPAQRDRYVVGTDFTLRYQPLGSGVYRGFTWGTEALFNSARFEPVSASAYREDAFGLYSYFETRLSRQVKVGLLFDWFEDPADDQAQTYRFSPYLGWNPSEFQTIRLQYSHTEPNRATGFRNSEAVYLQWTAVIGRHVHGFKQR